MGITVLDVSMLCLVVKFAWGMCAVDQSLSERRGRETGLGLLSSWREKIKRV